MNFELDSDQALLADSLARLLETPAEGRWQRFAEMGLLGLPLPEEMGGFGGTGTDLMIVMEAIGKAGAREPFVSAAILAGTMLSADPAHHETLAPLIAGDARYAVALFEPQSRYDLADIATVARNGRLNGHKIGVTDSGDATCFIVSARTSGARADEAGISLFRIARGAKGLSIVERRAPDGSESAELILADVDVGAAERIGAEGDGLPILRLAVDRAVAASCAEAVGGMARLFDITVEYLKTRRQFGQPIGSFQALQHRAADMLVEVELARSMAMYAAIMADDPDPLMRRSAVAAAKVQISGAARFVGQNAIQLHGGIGMSEEHVAGAYFRRLTQFERQFGDEAHFLREIDRCGGIGADVRRA